MLKWGCFYQLGLRITINVCFFHHFYLSSTTNTSASPSFHPQSRPCWHLPGHTPGPGSPYPSANTLDVLSSPPSVLSKPGSLVPGLSQLVPCQAGRVSSGSEAWSTPQMAWGQHMAACPLDLSLSTPQVAALWLSGRSFQKAGYPLAAAKSSKAGCQAAGVLLHFGKYSRIP